MNTSIISFLIYAATLISIGIYEYKKNQRAQSFNLANRSINYWVSALSANAADMSSWLFFGLPFAIYTYGLSECWTAIGLLAGMWGSWRYIAPRLRTESEKSGSNTLIHFLSHKSGDSNGVLTFVSAGLLLFFFLFYIAAQFKGIGAILSYSFGINYAWGVSASAALIACYVALGGYEAVAFIDAIQGLFLLTMLVLVPLTTSHNLAASSTLLPPSFALPSFSLNALLSGLATALCWGLGYTGMPHVLTKFMSIDSEKNIEKARWVSTAWQVTALSAATLTGILARSYFATPPASQELLFMTLVTEQFTPFLVGLILCAILAATISTTDAQLIVCASVLSTDVLQAKNPKTTRTITRISIILLSVAAAAIALTSNQSLYSIVRYAWSGLASTFGPLVIMSLYAPQRLTPHKAVFGIVIGGLTAAFWPLYGPFLQDLPLIAGFLSGLCTMYAQI